MSTTHISVGEPDANTAGPTQRPPRRRRRRGLAIAAVMVVVAAAAGAGYFVLDPFSDKADEAAAGSGKATTLAQVTEGPLSARTQENGTLGYGGHYDVVNQATGSATQLPSVGATIHQGQVLYRVGGKPVILLRGGVVPLYRALSRGMEGVDVRQLNTDLVDLGYAKKSVLDPDSQLFSRATATALKKLQDHVGLDDTGVLALSEAVFLPVKDVRVTKVNATRGAPVSTGGTMMEVSSTARQVSVSLNAAQQAEVKVGDKVQITLPNLKSTEGVVSAVGTVAKSNANGGPTVDVLITPKDPKATGQLDQAPVQVSIVTDSVPKALSVPVNALLALAGGGYAVEVVEADDTRRLVPVKPGLFDDSAGRVQVTGSGLSAGQNVVVPTS